MSLAKAKPVLKAQAQSLSDTQLVQQRFLVHQRCPWGYQMPTTIPGQRLLPSTCHLVWWGPLCPDPALIFDGSQGLTMTCSYLWSLTLRAHLPAVLLEVPICQLILHQSPRRHGYKHQDSQSRKLGARCSAVSTENIPRLCHFWILL